MKRLSTVLAVSARRHRHLCPRQVLGVRMGLLAGELLGLDLPRSDKRLLVIVETDGCVIDGIEAVTGCHVGGRSLRIEDYGKVAAAFVDTCTSQAVRLVPRREARLWAAAYAPAARNRWEAMLLGYQQMPAEQLFVVQSVRLSQPISTIVGKASHRDVCEKCGEEIINNRGVSREGRSLCRACAGGAYYQLEQTDITVAATSIQFRDTFLPL